MEKNVLIYIRKLSTRLSKFQKFIYAFFSLCLLCTVIQTSFLHRHNQIVQPKGLLYRATQTSLVTAALLTYTDTFMSFSYFKDTARRDELSKQLLYFYKLHNFRPIWFPAGIKANKTDTLLKILQQADLEGLNSQDYFLDSIILLSKKIENLNLTYNSQHIAQSVDKNILKDLAKLDVYTSAALLMFGLHKKAGKITLNKANYSISSWQYDQHFQDSIALYFYKNIHQKGFTKTLSETVPKNPQYHLLKKELSRYIKFKDRNISQIEFDNDSSYVVNDSSTGVFYLKKYLQATGDLTTYQHHTGIYDSSVYRAVKRFQFRNALTETGLADKETLKKLNAITNTMIPKISLNLERIKWKAYEISEKSILVNVPDFRVYYLENQQIITSMAVVTGKKSSPTPIFSDTLEYVIFNPTWGVPNDIARTEMLYKLRKNRNYLANNGYVLTGKVSKAKVDSRLVNWFTVSENNFPYYIMQKPGEQNSLGKVKFIFPNKAQVYLHDTPEHKLFLRKKRAFSHGCIRLECPPTMAFYVLKGVKDWNKAKIDEAMAKKEIRHVVLPKNQKIPVNITYQTAWVNEAGQLHLREDIYGHDAEQMK